MNNTEVNEINALPKKYQPLGAWGYFGYSLLFNIPLAGIICMIVFALDSNNICRRNYARSFFCIYVVYVIIIIICIATGLFSLIFSGMGNN